MVVTNFGASGLALLMAGQGSVPRYCAIGSGSGAEVVTLGSLVSEVLTDRRDFTTRDFTVATENTLEYNFNSVELSGLTLTEFGVGQAESKGTNDLWLRKALSAGVSFNGSNELQVSVTFKIINEDA